MSALLHYKRTGSGQTVVLIHGLFGNLDNLGLLERELTADYEVISLDLRNHGLSFHADEHNYQVMAMDVLHLMQHLKLQDIILIGHSMGGKVAMKITDMAPKRIARQIVMDMAPAVYRERKHDHVFAGLKAVLTTSPATRSEAMAILAEHIKLDGVRQFLGKSLYSQKNRLIWRFNVKALESNYLSILDWELISQCDVPTLFLKGANSDYLTTEHQEAIQAQFSNAKAHIISNAGHWLHAEKPLEVTRAIRRFLAD